MTYKLATSVTLAFLLLAALPAEASKVSRRACLLAMQEAELTKKNIGVSEDTGTVARIGEITGPTGKIHFTFRRSLPPTQHFGNLNAERQISKGAVTDWTGQTIHLQVPKELRSHEVIYLNDLRVSPDGKSLSAVVTLASPGDAKGNDSKFMLYSAQWRLSDGRQTEGATIFSRNRNEPSDSRFEHFERVPGTNVGVLVEHNYLDSSHYSLVNLHTGKKTPMGTRLPGAKTTLRVSREYDQVLLALDMQPTKEFKTTVPYRLIRVFDVATGQFKEPSILELVPSYRARMMDIHPESSPGFKVLEFDKDTVTIQFAKIGETEKSLMLDQLTVRFSLHSKSFTIVD